MDVDILDFSGTKWENIAESKEDAVNRTWEHKRLICMLESPSMRWRRMQSGNEEMGKANIKEVVDEWQAASVQIAEHQSMTYRYFVQEMNVLSLDAWGEEWRKKLENLGGQTIRGREKAWITNCPELMEILKENEDADTGAAVKQAVKDISVKTGRVNERGEPMGV